MCTDAQVVLPRAERIRPGSTLCRAISGRCGWLRSVLVAVGGAWLSATVGGAVGGSPPTRIFPFEEIGCFSRGAQLAYDRFGRLVVAQQGEFLVLNDTTWMKLWAENTADINLSEVCRAPDGSLLYGAFGSWGVFDADPDGGLHPRSLVLPDCPPWVRACPPRPLRTWSRINEPHT